MRLLCLTQVRRLEFPARDKEVILKKNENLYTERVDACLAVTCHLHFSGQNERDLFTHYWGGNSGGWNTYDCKSQNRKLTLETDGEHSPAAPARAPFLRESRALPLSHHPNWVLMIKTQSVPAFKTEAAHPSGLKQPILQSILQD